MQIRHHKPLEIPLDNNNKCEASLRFWIMTLKIIQKKRGFSPLFTCFPLISWTQRFSVFSNNICRLTCGKWEERKETVKWGCKSTFNPMGALGAVWLDLGSSYWTFALSSPVVSYLGYFSGLNVAICSAGRVWRLMQPSYQLWKVSVSLCRRSKREVFKMYWTERKILKFPSSFVFREKIPQFEKTGFLFIYIRDDTVFETLC